MLDTIKWNSLNKCLYHIFHEEIFVYWVQDIHIKIKKYVDYCIPKLHVLRM